jgi:hypothetical protein
MGAPTIELTIRYGRYGEQSKSVAVPVSEGLMEDLMEPVELSDEPWSLLIASPAFYGGKGDAVTMRKRSFKMRREVAQEIARAMVPALMAAFGVNDEVDGYRREQLRPDDPALRKFGAPTGDKG